MKKHEWENHMNCTLEFSHGYTFSKFAGNKLLLPFSFPSFFSFHFLFFPNHMDCTLEFSHGYTFSKLASNKLLLPFSFPSFFSFHFLFFSKLARPFMLSLWTFILESFYKVYPHVFLSSLPFYLFLISRGIYRVFLGFLMDLIKIK